MKNNHYILQNFQDIFLKPKRSSEVISQLIYGESFKILSKKKDWLKIETCFDNYQGFIKKDNLLKSFKPSHKIYKKYSNVYKIANGRFVKTNKFLTFASKLQILNKKRIFIEFEPNKWVKRSDLKKINHKIKDFNKIFKYFLNSSYKWGGKNYSGIDCSGLVQIFFYYNNVFCPRDTRDQIPFFKKMKNDLFKIKNKLIFWKGHVAISINNRLLIHAYGPKKKVVIMSIKKTISKIFKDTKLKPIYLI